MGWLVGAYAASPSLHAWRRDDEDRFMAGLKALQGVRGLEHPFYGTLHRWDDAWFLKAFEPRWDVLLTCIPGTMENLKLDPRFGLASDDEAGRRAALAFTSKALDAVHKLNEAAGRKAVVAVALHSAPKRRQAPSSGAAFARSLSEIARWDWQGAELLVEHIDAPVAGRDPDKGFLSLEEELAASDGTAGILLNWGRSAIEARDAAGCLRHIAQTGKRLRGLMFSGVTPDDALYGRWADSHAPFSDVLPGSLMTPESAQMCLKAAPGAAYTGFKIQALPQDLSVERRLALVRASVAALDLVQSGSPS